MNYYRNPIIRNERMFFGAPLVGGLLGGLAGGFLGSAAFFGRPRPYPFYPPYQAYPPYYGSFGGYGGPGFY